MRILFFLLLIACDNSGKTEKKPVYDGLHSQDAKELIEDSEKLQEDMARDIVLRGATVRQQNSVRGLLGNIKTNLFILRERPESQEALKRLLIQKNELENVPMQARDIEFLTPFIAELNTYMLNIARYQGTRLKELNWTVWSNSFDSGLGLFTTFSEKSAWQAGNRNRQGYVSARTRNDKTWLITPLINLENVQNPALRIDHLVNIKKSDEAEIDSNLINESAIKIMISTDYLFGDPEKATWTRLEIKKIPLIEDFTSSLSEKIDLSQYEEETISIAFVLDVESRLIGGHGLLWQINEIELLGATNKTEFVSARKDPTVFVFKQDFGKGLGDFQQIRSGENPAEFSVTTRNDESYLQVNGFVNKSDGVIMLVGPTIDLKDKNYALQLKQAINFYNAPAQEKKYIQILIGEDQGDGETIDWQELEISQKPPGNNWTPVISEWVNLPLKNKKVKIAFRYESGNGLTEYPNWSLYTLGIKEK